MDAIVSSPPLAIDDIEPIDSLLPRERPLAMTLTELGRVPGTMREPNRTSSRMALRRGLIFVATMILTGAGGYEMYEVLQVGGVTVLEAMVLVLFLVLLAWIAFSFASALAGFFVLLGGKESEPLANHIAARQITSRTAILVPTYNENPHQLTARLRGVYESLNDTGSGERFDWFVLSDTTDPDIWIAEERTFLELRQACGSKRLFYRHRSDNTARKSGNIAEWVTRFGGHYDFMIILDADSLMVGETIVRLVQSMEANPTVGLIQTLPVIVNAKSLFSRLQQFAGRLYGPMLAAGVAWWHGSESNYWGHNAIIRVQAFAQEAALPELRGRKPFGGHILSHDFVEAALMRRAGWGIYLAPTLGGSYEEAPPSLLDFAARDRRWCQGNLQHLALLSTRGLHWVSRLHFMTGIGSYLTAPLWLCFLLLGILISLQAQFVRPEYFPKGFSLYPTWPAQDSILAIWVFVATMGLLVAPKFLALFLLMVRREQRRMFGGGVRAFAGVMVETALSALIAPVMMIFQSIAVGEILMGRDAGWQAQRRGDQAVERRELYRKYAIPTSCGALLALSAYAISLPLLMWMSPVVIGLILAIPLGSYSARPSTGRLFSTPEEMEPPAVLVRANELASAPPDDCESALCELRGNASLLKQHINSLPVPKRRGPGQIDTHLAVARVKIEESDSFDEAVAYLTQREIRAVLGDRALLRNTLAKPN